MKLLIYSHFFAPSVGGVETAVLLLAEGLAQFRDGGPAFEVTVATNTPSSDFDDSLLPFRVVREPSVLSLAALIEKCDVLHVAGPSLLPLAISWLRGKAVVIEHHGYQAICPNGVLQELPQRHNCPGHFQARAYARCLRCGIAQDGFFGSLWRLSLQFPRSFLTRRAAANIAITDHVLRRHALPAAKRIYYGVDVPAASIAPSAPLQDTATFVFVGRFVPEKGIDVLLRASELLYREGWQFQLKLIGDGPERAAIETFISGHGLRECVELPGYLRGAALELNVQAARALVMPSVWEEAAGLSAIEQMMRGRLLIVSDTGGLGEIVGEAGLLCAPGNPEALAAQMRCVLQEPGLAAALGGTARQRALGLFKREYMVREHASLYRRLVNWQG